MRRTWFAALIVCTCVSACVGDPSSPLAPGSPSTLSLAEVAATTFVVTSAADSGPGTFREGIARASADPTIGIIRFLWTLPVIRLNSPLVYSGSQALRIQGNSAMVNGPSCLRCDALIVTGDADLSLNLITISNAAGNGVSIRMSASATGVIDVELRDVALIGNGQHGLLVDDQGLDPGEIPVPNDPAPFGFNSPASVALIVAKSKVGGNGFKGLRDFDGIRIEEGGPGGIYAVIDTSFIGGQR